MRFFSVNYDLFPVYVLEYPVYMLVVCDVMSDRENEFSFLKEVWALCEQCATEAMLVVIQKAISANNENFQDKSSKKRSN